MARVKQDTPASIRISNAIRITVLSPSVLIFITAVRLLIIANYDPTIASSIAASTGVVGTILGTLIPVVPTLLPLLALTFLVLYKRILLLFSVIGTVLVSPAYATLKQAWLATADQFSTAIHALSLSNPKLKDHALLLSWLHDRTSLICGAVAVVVIAFNKSETLGDHYASEESHPDYKLIDKIFTGFGVTFILLVIGVLLDVLFGTIFFFTTTIYRIPLNVNKISAIASQPWLPSEDVKLTSGKTFVGYTLNAGDVWQVFLQERDRTIEYFHSDDVASRTLCQLPETQRANHPPLIKLINAPVPVVPTCPEGS